MKTIVFDFDGTLADTFDLVIDSVNKLSKEYGHKPVTDPNLFREKGLREQMKENLFDISFLQIPSYIKKVKKLIKKGMKNIGLFPEIKALIEELSKNYEVAILTSNSKDTVEYLLKKESINNIKTIYSDSSIFGKDTVIKRFLKEENLSAEEVIYVGDETRDIQACKKAGVKIIAVSWGFNSENALKKENPDYLIEKPLEIINLLIDLKMIKLEEKQKEISA